MNKLNHQWRNIMRESKAKELKKDIEILSQTFERVVDRKESVIKSLVKDLLESEEQYFMALRSHLQNIDELTGKCWTIDVVGILPSVSVDNSLCRVCQMGF